jgi:hypothetical protein
LVVDQDLLQCLLSVRYLEYNKAFFPELNELALLTPLSLLPMGLLTFSSPLVIARQNGYIEPSFSCSSINFFLEGFDIFLKEN